MSDILHMPIRDIAMLALILLFVLTVLGLRILWDIYRVLVGFWEDYREVNHLREFKD
jgi:hypothetical protein